MSDTPVSPLSPSSSDAADVLLRPHPPRSWRERAEHVADATGTTPARLAIGAVVAAVAVGAALWLTRPAAAPPEVSLPFASSVPSSVGSVGDGAAARPSTTSTAEASEVVIDVEGAVLQPGVHHLHAGARVTDAVTAAGGLAPTADGARLNLAALLQDGQRVYVPAVGEEPPPVVGAASGAAGAAPDVPAAPVDLNAADEAALDALPGVGPATAAAIIQHREEIGGYTSVDQLLDVRGIGAAKLEQLRPLVTV